MKDMTGLVALVTGAGRGIGRSIALCLAREGAIVAAVARTESELAATAVASPRPGAIVPIKADLCRIEDVKRAVAVARERLGPIDLLINNAGVFLHKPVLDTTPVEWTRMFEVNTLSAVMVTREVLPDMLRRRSGRIINICSSASHRGYPQQAAYVAAKHALLGFTKSLAEETRGTGVHVHAVSPGGVNTSMIAVRSDINRADFMDPDDLAEVVCFLAAAGGSAVIDEIVVRRDKADPFR